jgi:peptide chain release factor 3
MTIHDEIVRRRTFAIISHPDAGKTTLTEKFLLYGGAVQLAGSVRARKNQRATTSDWMELEKQRGISVSSTVLQFDYRGFAINLLDTPGHKDFSEDTYRVLTAVDGVIMVIDAGKGIESQTRKLFEICRHRGVPIFTFMNKLDRPTKDPLGLLDELESVLGISAYPVNWPLGTGFEFRGVYDRRVNEVHLFETNSGGAYRAPVYMTALSDESVEQAVGHHAYTASTAEIKVLDAAGSAFDAEAVLAGTLTPVFFGSASNNFGVQMLLDAFLDHSSPPRPRLATCGLVEPERTEFSGFVFKIQANMDPRHRDRIAFIRVCSGRFQRDMSVHHVRTGRKVRLSSSHKLFARDRETVDEAFPGDIIGLVGHAEFRIGDTLTEDPAIHYVGIPRFAPECFGFLHPDSAAQFKRFRGGMEQLLQEGVVQSLVLDESSRNVMLLAAVGPLQFDVVRYRLESEYGAGSRLEPAPWEVLRWVDPEFAEESWKSLLMPPGATKATDSAGLRVLLFASAWQVQYFASKYPEIALSDVPYCDRVGLVY